jgi:hypothetical protein
MKTLAIASLLLCAVATSSLADKPKVNRAMIKAMENSIDNHLRGIWPSDPLEVLGLTQGAYVTGSGVVFVSEVNIAPSTGISPFHPAITKDEFLRIHEKKLTRISKLKEAMQEMLLSSAGSLDSVPADEQIALGITLFYWNGENTEGLPAQIVMHASKKALVSVKSGIADRSTLAAALRVEEF